MTAPRIVVADADPAVRRAVGAQLEEHGADVLAVADAEALRAALEPAVPQLLVLEADLPGGEGLQLLERITGQERLRDLPVIVLAALPQDEGAVRALGLGAADYLRKPVRPRELLARVQARLRAGAHLAGAREALARAQAELARVRHDAESRRTLVDILHEVTGDLSVPELFTLLVRRAARALGVSHCAVLLARPGATEGEVLAAVERPALHRVPVDLACLPEARAALDSGLPVLVADVAAHPLYAGAAPCGLDALPAPIRSAIALPFSVDRGQHGVFLVRRTLDQLPFAEPDLEFAEAAITAAVAVIQRAQVVEHAMADNARLERLAHTDPLTQLLNRRALTDRLQQEMERAMRYDATLALLMVDLDHFKAVNDTHGHLVGDDVLRDVARLLRETIRTTDIAARYGGEEFLVLLPETDDGGAEAFAERIRVAVEAHPFEGGSGAVLRLTASLGVAVFPAPRVVTAEDLLVRADAALYRAKADGRNRVCT